MFGIFTILIIVGLFILILYNAWLYEVTSTTPTFPMTKLEAKSMDIKSRLQEIKHRREVQEYNVGNNYYNRGNDL
jgi:uncharacterized protein YpmB